MTTAAARTVGFQPRERNVFFHILTACNLACRHCYINPTQHGTAAVSGETMEQWLQLFYDPARETNLIFLGGEPTLHPELAAGIKTARQLGYRSVTVDSNGFLFHDLLGKITPAEAVISFSLDGPTPEVNDPLRGQGVFAVCTANIKKAVAMGFDVSLIYTVSRINIEHLARMPALLAELGVKRFFIQVIGIRGKSAGPIKDQLQLTPEEWLTVIPQVAQTAAAMGIHVIFPKVFLDQGEEFLCAGRVADNYFIFPNGRVYRCPLCEDFPLHSLTLSDGRLTSTEKINESDLFNLDIPEGCVMNRLIQPDNIQYETPGKPRYKIACCLLKETLLPDTGMCPG